MVHPGISLPDLRGVDLRGVDLHQAHLYDVDLQGAQLGGANLNSVILREADLRRANLIRAELSGADLRRANLSEAYLNSALLRGAHLREADLHGVILGGADLYNADLWGADLRSADLRGTNLSLAELSGADLRRADLGDAYLHGTELRGADFSEAVFRLTTFSMLDLSVARGLETVDHRGPSSISTNSLSLSRGKIPEEFLRRIGLAPWEVLSAGFYDPALNPAQFSDLLYQVFDAWTKGKPVINGCFISYSWKDAKFVDKLRDRLVAEGVNVWLDRRDMIAGTIQDQIWRAIQIHHVVILVLSKDSVQSDWVENELDMARKKEKTERRAVLCPLALDDAWKAKVDVQDGPGDPSRTLWRTLQQKLVVDFSHWKTKSFEEAIQKLLRGLKVNYGPADASGE